MAAEQLIVFVKAPRPGIVKTRLAQTIGDQAACSAYCRLVEALIQNLAGLDEVEMRFTPDDAAEEIQPWLKPSWRARPQGEGDLGRRMQRAFQAAFQSGAERVVIIGSDCPSITGEDIRTAWAALADNEMALGPAADGGYWLIALRSPRPDLFLNMPWSRSTVFAETVRRADQAGLRVFCLRELADVDTEEDWKHARLSLRDKTQKQKAEARGQKAEIGGPKSEV